jgi:hypothetical protein
MALAVNTEGSGGNPQTKIPTFDPDDSSKDLDDFAKQMKYYYLGY